MTYTEVSTQAFLEQEVSLLAGLPPSTLQALANKCQRLRYKIGQPLLRKETMPHQVAIVQEGHVRLLGYHAGTGNPLTLGRLGRGVVVGWAGLVRGVPCETAIASTDDVICVVIPALAFMPLLEKEPQLLGRVQGQVSKVELCEILGQDMQRRAHAALDFRELLEEAYDHAQIQYAAPDDLDRLSPDYTWWVSSGRSFQGLPTGSRLDLDNLPSSRVPGVGAVRLLGIPTDILEQPLQSQGAGPADSALLLETAPQESLVEIVDQWGERMGGQPGEPDNGLPPIAPPIDPGPANGISPVALDHIQTGSGRYNYPHIRGKGIEGETLACFEMLARHLQIPFRRDVIKRVISEQQGRSNELSLLFCGAVTELMGLKTQHATVPAASLSKVPGPAMIAWGESFAVLYESSTTGIVLGVPSQGIIRIKTEDIPRQWGRDQGEVLLVQTTKSTPQQKFGIKWFLPALAQHRKVLIEVLIASFFVQLFGLANPLMIQVIIDKVITQNSTDTLQVLGLFLVIIAIFEALLTSLRTYLFVDTTNRIDLSLGSEIIDHLLRLPLRYFEKRPVGELASRVNELENIRQFLTGTALTVVLDAIFSVIYIIVMVIYSWQLTLVSLASIPLFVGITLIAAPIVRGLLRVKANHYARTQSYLVEALSGIQTVKAQNIELKARWQWQERYSRYVSSGFKTVVTSTIASSSSDFLNKLSALMVLWVGAYLVLQQDLTLGQLIAFRIIAGYVTGPLLRLAQLWQNFQETALSLERLSDILDTPQEETEDERNNILMPLVQGHIRYEDISFRFGTSGPLQLTNVNLEIPQGTFVGIVGQSGSGKSTITKLLARLYDPTSGRILVDNYDIGKVELYSLRRQIGIVPQDSLLFDGTVQDNIALTRPEASSEAIIEAATVACAHDFIMDLSQAYNTSVGERGSSLSGGQRQRVAIARTILQNPSLLIMDEATSALDYDTERQVCLNLKSHFRGRTVLFITHRLSTIQSADLIIVMDKGALVEQGTHQELMAMRGRYYCLYQQQDRNA